MSGKRRYPGVCPLDEAVRPHTERSVQADTSLETESWRFLTLARLRRRHTQRARPRRRFGLNELWPAQMPPNRLERAPAGRARAGSSVGAMVHRAPVFTARASTRLALRRAGRSDGARCSPEVAVMVEAGIEFLCGLTFDMSGKNRYPGFCPLDEAVRRHVAPRL